MIAVFQTLLLSTSGEVFMTLCTFDWKEEEGQGGEEEFDLYSSYFVTDAHPGGSGGNCYRILRLTPRASRRLL